MTHVIYGNAMMAKWSSESAVICGDALEMLKQLPDGIVQTCVTSPPYYGLRDYGAAGQIGLEPTPEEFIARLVAVFHEVKRVLRDNGTCWINIGDSYATNQKGSGGANPKQLTNAGSFYNTAKTMPKTGWGDAKEKDLLGIPWMLAFALRADGWYLRNEIIWAKPNPMPESVTDRCTKSHEQIFLLSKSAQYFCDMEAIREPNEYKDRRQDKEHNHYGIGIRYNDGVKDTDPNVQRGVWMGQNPDGRNKRDVWTVSTKPYSGAHFATFPRELIVPCILAGTSAQGACPKCGTPWERNIERVANYGKRQERDDPNGKPQVDSSDWKPATVTDYGWQPACECGDISNPVPQIVLDPFGGAGTTAKTAQELGREYITIELNQKYVDEIILPRLAATSVPLPMVAHQVRKVETQGAML